MRQFSNSLAGLLLVGMLFLSAAVGATTFMVGSAANPAIPSLSVALRPNGFGAAFKNLTGDIVEVYGTFTVDLLPVSGVDQPWTLNNVQVRYTSSSSKILVAANCALSASNVTRFTGLTSSITGFLAVHAKENSHLVFNDCRFLQANPSISMDGSNIYFNIQKTTFSVRNTFTGMTIGGLIQNANNHTFTDNRINLLGAGTGIRITTSNGFPSTPSNSSITLTRNEILGANEPGSTGIWMGPNISNVTVQGSINNLNQVKRFGLAFLGIAVKLDKGCTNILVDLAGGERCGTALQTEQALNRLTMKRCKFTGCSNDAVKIQAHEFTNPVSGSTSVTVEECNFQANKSGILITSQLSNSGWYNIRKDTIEPESFPTSGASTMNYGITVQNLKRAYSKIWDCWVKGGNSASAAGGIHAWQGPGWPSARTIILDNKVTLGLNQNLRFGIGVFEFEGKVQIVGNHIGKGISPSANNYKQGIYLDNVPNAALLCSNEVDCADHGVLFTGAQNNYQIWCTTFNNHANALDYDHVQPFNSGQTSRGNCWQGATALDAVFDNADSQGIGDPSAVFEAKYKVPNGCVDLNKVLVNGAVNTNDWFTDNGQTTTCTKTETDYCGAMPVLFVNSDEAEVLTPGDEWAANPQSNHSMDVVHWTAGRNLYGKLVRNPNLANAKAPISAFNAAASTGNLDKFYQVETGIANLYENSPTSSAIATTLANLQSVNNNIATVTEAESNQKSMNTILLTAMQNEDWDFAQAEKMLIDNVASYCPQVGGGAVYLARHLQENYREPDWSMTNCTFVHERSGRVSNTVQGFACYPNPANETFQLQLDEDTEEDILIDIYDLTGKLVKSDRFEANGKNGMIPVSGLASGTYFVKIAAGHKTFAPQKIILLH